MTRAISALGVVSVLALSACAVAPPQGPASWHCRRRANPSRRSSRTMRICRGYASQQTGGASSAQAANNSAVGSAVLGTAIGAGLGAALGSVGGAVGAGAAIGGATGLLAGSAIGANNAQAAGGNVQARYDTAYTQCMYSQGQHRAECAGRLCRRLSIRLSRLLSRPLLRPRLFRSSRGDRRRLGIWRLAPPLVGCIS